MGLFFVERCVMLLHNNWLPIFRHEGMGFLNERSEGVSDSMAFAYPGHHNIISNTLSSLALKIIAKSGLLSLELI